MTSTCSCTPRRLFCFGSGTTCTRSHVAILQCTPPSHVCCTPPHHKDAVDLETRKRELSKNRAERVYKFLHSRGIGKVRMTFKGYGNTQPIGKDEQFDRRVELVITKI
ncbi:MAG: OmpA family protein [Flavobacterium sp.]